MTQQILLQLSEEQIDDLLYFARASETDNFFETLAEIKTSTTSTDVAILLATRDGYSGNNALHMTAGNGHLGLSSCFTLNHHSKPQLT